MIFYRALRREFSTVAAGVFVALFGILLTTVLLRLLAQAAGGAVPVDAVVSLIGLGALGHLPIVLSLSVFVAVLVALSRAYRDSEMVVWASSGQSLLGFLVPVLQFAVPFALIVGFCSLYLSPWAQYKGAEYKATLKSRDDTTRVAPGVFRESASAGRVFFVEGGSTEEASLENVFISSERDGVLDIIVAARGKVETNAQGEREVFLEGGRRFEGQMNALAFRVLEFARYRLRLGAPEAADIYERLRAVPTARLWQEATPEYLGELSVRLGMPVLCLLLALTAVPLAHVNPRAGRGTNLLIAILVYLTYSNMLNIFQAWVAQRHLAFWLASLLPHLVVVGVLVLLLYKRIVLRPFWRRGR